MSALANIRLVVVPPHGARADILRFVVDVDGDGRTWLRRERAGTSEATESLVLKQGSDGSLVLVEVVS